MFELWNVLKEKEIILSQNGRYVEFNKRNSPYVYKIDLAEHTYFCEKKSSGEHVRIDATTIRRWFDAKVVTEDKKLATMFKYSEKLSGRSGKIDSILEYFTTQRLQRFEKWLGIGVEFYKRDLGWGNSSNSGVLLNYDPNEISRDARKFVATKKWHMDELNSFVHGFKEYDLEDDNTVNKLYQTLADHPEYQKAFIAINYDGSVSDFSSAFYDICQLARLIEEYNMEIERLLFYMDYLNNVEYVMLIKNLAAYKDYLEMELEKQGGRKNRMYKYPVNFHTITRKYAEIARREEAMSHYSEDDDSLFENEYLEYEDDQFKMIIPRSAADVRDEGRQQGHCVASHFLEYIADGRTAVVFMRRTAEPEKSLITIEIRDKHMRQACIGDNDPVPREYRGWIEAWAEEKGVRITSDSWDTRLAF